MANRTGDPRGPGMPASGGWFPATDVRPERVVIADHEDVDLSFTEFVPRNALIVLPDDKLVVQATSSITTTLILQYRILRADGEVIVSSETLSVLGRTNANLFSRNLPKGLLLSASVLPAVFFPFDESVYASIGIFRGALSSANRVQTLAGGYITNAEGCSYPNGGYHEQTEGIGNQVAYNMGAVGAGLDLSYTVQAGSLQLALSVQAVLTTSATVANRQVQLVIDDSSNVFFTSPIGVAQTASLAWTYCFARYPFATLQFGTTQLIFADFISKLGASVRVRTVTTGLQAGDQWTLQRINVEQWMYM